MDNHYRYIYTIIIPHYNIPDLLKRCLFSIPKRDDTQVIVVDDKSTKDNISKLKSLEILFSNVTFLYSDENGGGGKARNVGLDCAEGKFVLFADADDFFNYCINDILDEYQNEDADIVFFNASHVDTETYLPTKRVSTLQSALRMYQKSNSLDAFRFVFGEPWCKIIRRSIIDEYGIKFDEISIHNDTKFSYLTGYYAKCVKFDNRALYCLADRSGSVSKSLANDKNYIRTRVFAEKNRFMISHEIDYFDNMMIIPLWEYLKRLDYNNFKKCLSIAKENGFSNNVCLSRLALFVLRVVILRNKM